MSKQPLATGTIQGREAFIANLSSRLGRKATPETAPAHPFRGAPEFYREVECSTEEKISLFTESWTALTGKVLVVDEAEAREKVAAWLVEVAKELGVTHVSRWEHEGLKALGLDEALTAAGIGVVPWAETDPAQPIAGETVKAVPPLPETSVWTTRSELLQRTERCQLGIVWPDYAVANTGTMVLQCSPERGRSVSLLTRILFAVVRADQLVFRMGEAFGRITEGKASPQDYASSLNLITGPSRSADIENDLTIGIHGPGKVYAVIIK